MFEKWLWVDGRYNLFFGFLKKNLSPQKDLTEESGKKKRQEIKK